MKVKLIISLAFLRLALGQGSGSYESYLVNDPPAEVIHKDHSENVFEVKIDCKENFFPIEDFNSQNDSNKVYFEPAEFSEESTMKKLGFKKFVSVFGLRIIADESVSDEQMAYVVKKYYLLLVSNDEGKPDNKNLVKYLRDNNASIFIVKSFDVIQSALNENDPNSFFFKAHYCNLPIDFEESSRIQPNGQKQLAKNEENDESKNDRTLAIISDHVIGRGFFQLFTEEEYKKLEERTILAVNEKRFYPANASCPQDDIVCAVIIYLSWTFSLVHGYDSAWCSDFNIMPVCSKNEIIKHEPYIINLLNQHFPNFKVN